MEKDVVKKDMVVIDENLDAPIDKVWKALTDTDEMDRWYFIMDDFQLEVGSTFTFYSGGEETKYLHICKILEIKPEEKLSYSWRYEDLEGESVVSFYLYKHEEVTHLKLTHEGLDSFPQDKPDFTVESFRKGWEEIISISLKEYVEAQ